MEGVFGLCSFSHIEKVEVSEKGEIRWLCKKCDLLGNV